MGAALDLSARRIAAARQCIAANAVLTPVIDADWVGSRVGATVKFKAECLQRTGSFKVRGVSVRLNGARERFGAGGVVAASAGNHARALAYVAARAGIACQVFMPSTASVSKINAVQAAGASLSLRDESVDGCLEHAREYADANDATLVHPFDDAEIVLGQATLGAELLEQIPEMRTVVLPVGGGGLASGVAAILKQTDPTIRVVGVQSDLCASIADPGRPVDDLRFALADGIAVKHPGELTAPLVERYVDELCTVDEDAIAEAIVALMQHGKLVVEGAGRSQLRPCSPAPSTWTRARSWSRSCRAAISISIAFRPRAGCTSPVRARRSTSPPRSRTIPGAWPNYWLQLPRARETCSRSSTSATPVSGVSTKPASRSCFRHGALSTVRRS